MLTLIDLFLALVLVIATNTVLSIIYAVYLAYEEKKLTGGVSTRRILESALMVTGTVSNAMWFIFIFLIFYLPLLVGGTASTLLAVWLAHRSHGEPNPVNDLYAIINLVAIAYFAYLAYEPLVFVALTGIVYTFIITDMIITMYR